MYAPIEASGYVTVSNRTQPAQLGHCKCSFFFSSRRRHTRFDCDWSSDVCSSDLAINYRTKEMLFGPIESLTFSAPFDTDTPVVTIRMEFENRQLRLVVDTGSPDLMLFQSRMQDSTGVQVLGSEEVADVSGTFRRRKVRIPRVYRSEERRVGKEC